MLKFVLITSLAALAIASADACASDSGPFYGDVETWAALPDGVRFPEGITANPSTGDIYAGTFDFGPNSNKLVRFARDGHVVAQKDFGATPLLGLGFAAGKVYILNFGGGPDAVPASVQRIDANFTATSTVETVAVMPSIGPPAPRTTGNPDGTSDLITFGNLGKSAPNGLVFDHANNMYVSDSFQGAIFRIAAATTCATPCPVETISHDSQLATAGFPPFGANGLALNANETVLYIAVTGDNRVVQMNVASTAITPFAESLHGADGLLFDNGVLWVAENQGDHVTALDSRGRVVAKIGEFEGIRRDGSPRGLLFPASMVISGNQMYVTNLALPLTPQVGDEPEEDVTHWNIARFHVPH